MKEILGKIDLELLKKEKNLLNLLSNLKKTYGDTVASIIYDTIIYEDKKKTKLPNSKLRFFTRESLEQVTNENVLEYRDRYIRAKDIVFEFCCSIGIETINFAKKGNVFAYDIDDIRLAICDINLEINGLSGKIRLHQADLTKKIDLFLDKCDILFFDPARRDKKSRKNTGDDYLPPLNIIYDYFEFAENIIVKCGPTLNWKDYPEFSVDFISDNKEMKEITLCRGNRFDFKYQAVKLPEQLFYRADYIFENKEFSAHICKYLYEPDPALYHSGLINNFAMEKEIFFLDNDLIYLTGNDYLFDDWVVNYEVLEEIDGNIKRVNKILGKYKVKDLVIKKRNFGITPEELLKKIKIDKDKSGEIYVLFFFSIKNKNKIILGMRK